MTRNSRAGGKQPSVLFLSHIENTFERFFRSGLVDDIVATLSSSEFDRIILLRSGYGHIDPRLHRRYVWSASKMVHPMPTIEVWSWGWGYNPEYHCGCFHTHDWRTHEPWECVRLIETRHGYTWIPPELSNNVQELGSSIVYTAGGCTNECLADWEEVLDFYQIRYQRVNDLTYTCHVCRGK
jgi:hypothetical protein